MATAGILLAMAACASAFTLPSEIDKLLAFKALMDKRGEGWRGNLANWTCPTPPATSNGSCDPCGARQWWGNWPYVGCRGFSIRGLDELGGNGYVTNLHFTNDELEGPDLPIQQICDVGLITIKELDIDGNFNATPPMGGTIPEVYGRCFPLLSTSKLSFNRLTGTLPTIIANNTVQQALKIRSNLLTGSIPEEIAAMPILYSLDLSLNNLSGTIPKAFRKSNTMSELTLSNNDFEGNFYSMPQNLFFVETANNPKLCGMIPASVRWAHGFNPARTGLGKPCPGETYPIDFPAGF